MTALTDIGVFTISDSLEGGKDYFLRPSFEAITRIGNPEDIVKTFAIIHGSEVADLINICTVSLGGLPEWLSPSFNRAAEKLFFSSWQVLQACCEEDLAPVIGEWKAWSNCVVYRPGRMPKNDIIVMAQQLMQHGILGKAKVRKLQRHETGEKTNEFRSMDYIVAAQIHFGISEEEASGLTMTKFQMLLAAKYPEQKGFTKEEYEKIADDYLAKQAARRATLKP
ncbi:DUF6246 family protein [Citrobacter freundii]|uniref:DUF6246 family protein n=1 Tax=Citrobacter freundii TaxID=546 RepID=UPI000B548A0B|nr:DUF6246 family protein [Citrobacter freundii]ASG44774.1 hypothetical protein CES93_14575 [Citrobacter freundii]